MRFRLNGEARSAPRDPSKSLLELLRVDLALTGTKYGCGEGECGACTVLLDGAPARACRVLVADLDGRSVVTVEGLEREGVLSPVQQAFAESGAFQCGFCTPGMVVGATALLRDTPHPTPAEVVEALDGHLCRCGGYTRILRAVQRAAEIAAERGSTRP